MHPRMQAYLRYIQQGSHVSCFQRDFRDTLQNLARVETWWARGISNIRGACALKFERVESGTRAVPEVQVSRVLIKNSMWTTKSAIPRFVKEGSWERNGDAAKVPCCLSEDLHYFKDNKLLRYAKKDGAGACCTIDSNVDVCILIAECRNFYLFMDL